MTVDPAAARDAGLVSEHGGETYVFCNPNCKARFDEEPAAFLDEGGTS